MAPTVADSRLKGAPVEATVYSPDRGESADEAKRFIDSADEGVVMVVQIKAPIREDRRGLDAVEEYVKSLRGGLERVARQRLTLERLLDALTPEERPPSPAAVLQVRRNAEARKRLLEEFGALTSTEVAELAGSTAANRSATANRWRQEHRIFGVRHHDVVYYPGFQFGSDGRPLPVLRDVLDVLSAHGLTDWEIALWFTTSARSLGDRRPVDLLAADPGAVVEAARLEVAPVSG
ncbi:MAG: hypothetical protein ACRDM1_09690 [Gaiellaceae bacterium]